MELHDQICTPEQAMMLKNFGINQESLFYWNKPKSGPHGSQPHFGNTSNAMASAFTAAELGRMIPDKVTYTGVECFVFYQQVGVFYYSCVRQFKRPDLLPEHDILQAYGYTEAVSRAQLIIKCIDLKIPEFSIASLNQNLK